MRRMIPFAQFTWLTAAAGRWVARVAGGLMALFLLAFIIGEGPPPLLRMTAREQLFAVGMGCLYGGLIVAWKWPAWGGVLSLAGWGLLWIFGGRPQWSFPFTIPAAVGVLHLLCWWRLRGPAPPLPPPDPRLKIAYVSLWAAVALFVLLSANEVFGMPPLMATPRRPPPALLGTWSADLPGSVPMVLIIAPDGGVSGAIGDAELVRARFTGNRSWFGRLMRWRTGYLVRGELSRPIEPPGGAGGRFTAPLDARGTQLAGSLFLSHPGKPRPLRLVLKRR